MFLSIRMLAANPGSGAMPTKTASFGIRPEGLIPNPKARLKGQFHEVCRFKHVAIRTEESYWGWVVRLVRFFESKIHPKDLSSEQLKGFLTHLATVERVAASTQNQALRVNRFAPRG